jgi:hypothetical protein
MGYATRTGTRRNLLALERYGWRLLLNSAKGNAWNSHGFPYAIDNGAWTAFTKGTEWDEDRFRLLTFRYGAHADWIALPDIVCGGLESLDRSLSWIDQLGFTDARLLVPVQDGMTAADLRAHVSDRVGLFVGGSEGWKLRTLPMWGALKQETGCYLHVGRVNSARRIALCAHAGADSFDGTSPTRFSVNTKKLSAARDSGNSQAFLSDAWRNQGPT